MEPPFYRVAIVSKRSPIGLSIFQGSLRAHWISHRVPAIYFLAFRINDSAMTNKCARTRMSAHLARNQMQRSSLQAIIHV